MTSWLVADDPVPALLVRPRGVVSLDEAHAAIEQWEHYSRKRLDQAQRVAVEAMMAEGPNGRWAARTTVEVKSRQNGKGDDLEVVESWGLAQRAEAIVHTAHEIPTSKSAHQRLVAFFQSHRDLRRLIRTPRFANGDQAIPMVNGGVIVYRTRTAGGGRGLDDISRLVIDEGQWAQPEQLASSTPILAANPNPQINFAGTAGILGRSDWWWSLRLRALRGDDDGFAYVEHSAERVELNRDGRVVSTPPRADDLAAWRLANPAFPERIEEGFLREQLKTLGPALFAREHLCVWDPHVDSEGGVIPFDQWTDLGVDPPPRVVDVAYGLSVSLDGRWAAVGSAGRLPDGDLYVDCVKLEQGTGWVVAYLESLLARKRLPVRVDPGEGAGAFIAALREARVEVVELGPREYQQSCGALYAAVLAGKVRHIRQESLSRAVAVAERRDIGHEGGWVWAHPVSIDISSLKAATVAASGVSSVRRRPRIHAYDPDWSGREEVSV